MDLCPLGILKWTCAHWVTLPEDHWKPVHCGRINSSKTFDLQLKYDNKIFEVKIDVENYKPEDLNVKIVGDELTVAGKMKSSDEHSVMSSEFSRLFTIPEVP